MNDGVGHVMVRSCLNDHTLITWCGKEWSEYLYSKMLLLWMHI